MPEKIDFKDLNIQNLFNSFYIVPEYQREYVWEEKEVMLLLTDIFGNFDSNPNSEYFLGSIVVCKTKKQYYV